MDMQFDHVARQVPDIAEAVAWYMKVISGSRILYQDETWALLDARGVKLALIGNRKHPDHVAWRVSQEELERVAAMHNKTIMPHRDDSRSIYLPGPGGESIEIIAYPESE